ncbi:M15 family metallopeptidase [Candidatus Saccharibacteria bacterium]|nr:M15 family metallopeptidase [Candidatus Saccharibacteria bacterium]
MKYVPVSKRRLHKRILIFSIIFVSVVTVAVATFFIVRAINTPQQPEENSEEEKSDDNENEENQDSEEDTKEETSTEPEEEPLLVQAGNCTVNWGKLMLINYHFTVDQGFISNRRTQLINLTETYGINELNAYNGVPLLDAEAAAQLNAMINDYESTHSGHEMKTVSCFRSYGTSCGRLCAATGTSEHHSGYACDLIDPAYGTSLDTDTLPNHIEWQWLKENSYKYGFIDRYPEEWAGGSMAQPLNVDENGSTGYYETWHYRYVGNPAATEIATGKYNNGKYDSFEHYLKTSGRLKSLTSGSCL